MSIKPSAILPGTFQRFFRTEALSGLLLLTCAGVALVLANSPWGAAVAHFWEIPLAIGLAENFLSLTLHQWINDGLMAAFFLLVGLEIKRELVAGELASVRQAALPVAGAIGGMVVPAALYWIFNPSGPAARGWGIPMATDIAFALGVLALIAPNVPIGAKIFLTALAIVDDMGAVLVIAIFYSAEIAWTAVAAAGLIVVLLISLNLAGVRRLWPYLFSGLALWYFVHESGIHATIAGVVLAFTIPVRTRLNAVEFSARARRLLDEFDRTETGDSQILTSKGQQEALFSLERASELVTAPILRLEHGLHKLSAFVVMPLFAFSNAGLSLGQPVRDLGVVAGIAAGLALGKPLGITGAVFLAIKLRLAQLPDGVSWRMVHACSWLAGIGFTMSLFIAMLAFEESALVDAAKLSIFVTSVFTAVVAAMLLRSRSASAVPAKISGSA